MKIIALEIENEHTNQLDYLQYAKEEAEVVWQLYKKEIILEIYFRADQKSAVIILESENIDDAKSILEQLPFVKNNLIHFDLIPLSPYDGFERLFK